MNPALLQLEEPADYFTGIGEKRLPTPFNILLYVRVTKNNLQQEALQNRSHHRFVLAFNLRTEGCVHLNNLALPFKPGQALLIHPYQFHHFGQLASTQLQWLFCTFELEPRAFLEPLRNRVVDVGEASESILHRLLKEWHQASSELQTARFQTTLLSLLLTLKEDRQQAASDLPPESQDNLIRTINHLMAEWHGRTVVVADLAEAVGLSESRVRVLFKEAAGIPLGSYIQNYRINRAMSLLRTSTLSIAEVADDAGFGSPQAFSRIFKRATGHTPRAYRSPPTKPR